MTESRRSRLSIGQCATLACLLEATATKPGNVHRGADFDDLNYFDFLASAVVVAPALERAAGGARLGECLLAACEATRAAADTNTNLGTLLLLVPLAMVPAQQSLEEGVNQVLEGLDARDAELVYQAIRIAAPGGLGQVDEADVAGPPPADLVAAMRLAADRDLVARQYCSGFHEVLRLVVPWLGAAVERGWPLGEGIVHAHLRLMSQFPDSLIARKCGVALAQESAARAAKVLAAGGPEDPAYYRALEDFDFWLRSDHHRRNPGTTADLLAAGLFAALRDDIIELPIRFYP